MELQKTCQHYFHCKNNGFLDLDCVNADWLCADGAVLLAFCAVKAGAFPA